MRAGGQEPEHVGRGQQRAGGADADPGDDARGQERLGQERDHVDGEVDASRNTPFGRSAAG